jgi:GDP-L-fucose synthase
MTKVLVTGGTGMLGRSLVKKLNETNLPVLTPNRSELDLSDFNSVKNYFEYFKPSIVFHCAASVGGIQANVNSKSLFLTENYVIDFNVLTSAREQRVSRLAYVGSSCMYPAGLNVPMSEELLLTGPLEKTNESYALSKIMGTKFVEAVREQDSLSWHTFIASNLYGPYDNFDPQNSHLLASIIRKVHDSKKTKLNEIEIWGTGRSRREFTYVEDFADFMTTLILSNRDFAGTLNVGYGQDFEVRDFYRFVMETAGVSLNPSFNYSMPEGNARKLMDSAKAINLGWKPKTDIMDGIRQTYEWYVRDQN